ncbi:MAG: N-acetyltransferase [Alphaproteobacteria bacterium]|nr:N-acetyltransferase [Alphaproteobacteria bacterium]
MPITNNTKKNRYELEIDGHIAFADYRLDGNIIHIPHVEAPPKLRGTGAAGKLMQGIMQIAETENLKIRPICSYAASWLEKHPEYQHLRA